MTDDIEVTEDPEANVTTRQAVKALWRNAKTPILMAAAAVAGAVAYSRVTSDDGDEDDVLDVFETETE